MAHPSLRVVGQQQSSLPPSENQAVSPVTTVFIATQQEEKKDTAEKPIQDRTIVILSPKEALVACNHQYSVYGIVIFLALSFLSEKQKQSLGIMQQHALTISRENWELIFKAPSIDEWIDNIGHARRPSQWFLPLIEFFNAHREQRARLFKLLEILAKDSQMHTLEFFFTHLEMDEAFYEEVLNNRHLETFLTSICLDSEGKSLYCYETPSPALIQFFKKLLLSKNWKKLAGSKLINDFLHFLKVILKEDPSLGAKLPVLYPEVSCKDAVLLAYFKKAISKKDFLNLLAYYPDLPYPQFLQGEDLQIQNKLKEVLGDQLFTPMFAWAIYFFGITQLTALSEEDLISVIEKLTKDNSNPAISILFNLAVQCSMRFKDGFYLFEFIYERLSKTNRTLLIDASLNSLYVTYDRLGYSHPQLIQELLPHLHLQNNTFRRMVGIPRSQLPLLDKICEGFTLENWKTVVKEHLGLVFYVLVFLPQFAKKVVEAAENQKQEDAIFLNLSQFAFYPDYTESLPPIEKESLKALEAFLKALPDGKAKPYRELLIAHSDPIAVLKQCGKEKALFIQKAYQLKLYQFLLNIILQLTTNQYRLHCVALASFDNLKEALKNINYLSKSLFARPVKVDDPRLIAERKVEALCRFNDPTIKEDHPEVKRLMEEMAKEDSEKISYINSILRTNY